MSGLVIPAPRCRVKGCAAEPTVEQVVTWPDRPGAVLVRWCAEHGEDPVLRDFADRWEKERVA